MVTILKRKSAKNKDSLNLTVAKFQQYSKYNKQTYTHTLKKSGSEVKKRTKGL